MLSTLLLCRILLNAIGKEELDSNRSFFTMVKIKCIAFQFSFSYWHTLISTLLIKLYFSVPKPVLEVATKTEKAGRVDEEEFMKEIASVRGFSYLQYKLSVFIVYTFMQLNCFFHHSYHCLT